MYWSTYIYNKTIDTAMTGDGIKRVIPLLGDVEPYVTEQHVAIFGTQKQDLTLTLTLTLTLNPNPDWRPTYTSRPT